MEVRAMFWVVLGLIFFSAVIIVAYVMITNSLNIHVLDKCEDIGGVCGDVKLNCPGSVQADGGYCASEEICCEPICGDGSFNGCTLDTLCVPDSRITTGYCSESETESLIEEFAGVDYVDVVCCEPLVDIP